jgi:hypothetical protein
MKKFILIIFALGISTSAFGNTMAQSRYSVGPKIENGTAMKSRHSVGPSIENAMKSRHEVSGATKPRHSMGPEMDVNNNNATRGRHSVGPDISNAVQKRHLSEAKVETKSARIDLNAGF